MFNRVVVVAGLGYFVDIYDLVVFLVVRIESLNEIGITDPDAVTDVGVLLLNMQMSGLLLGGFLWGILGDKRGRLSTLFGSIALYSVANVANAFVTNVPQYAVLRFVAGVGLAGELGAGITLVAETMPNHLRGYGSTIVTSLGIMGAVAAEIVAGLGTWQLAYLLGGLGGLLLLATQFYLAESGAFVNVRQAAVSRGDLRLLFSSRARLTKYVYVILIGVPVWYTIGVLVAFSPELSNEMGAGAIDVGAMVAWNYGGAAVGGLFWGPLSERLKSRRWVLILALAFTAATVYAYVLSFGIGAAAFYALSFGLGFGTGYWPVFMTVAAEQFGTNLRATVTTTSPNFVRGATVPITFGFLALSRYVGLAQSAMFVGVLVLLLALWSVRNLGETYGTDLDFVEVRATGASPARVR